MLAENNLILNKKVDYMEKLIENNISNEKFNKNEMIKIMEKIYIKNKIKPLFGKTIPKDINLLYSGFNREEFFKIYEGKNNLLFLVNDERGEEYGGYISSKLIKNNKGEEIYIKDDNSFIFNL